MSTDRTREITEFQQYLNQLMGSLGARVSTKHVSLLVDGAQVLSANHSPEDGGWYYEVMFGTHSSEPGQVLLLSVRDPAEQRRPGVWFLPALDPDGFTTDPPAWVVIRTALTPEEQRLLDEGDNDARYP